MYPLQSAGALCAQSFFISTFRKWHRELMLIIQISDHHDAVDEGWCCFIVHCGRHYTIDTLETIRRCIMLGCLTLTERGACPKRKQGDGEIYAKNERRFMYFISLGKLSTQFAMGLLFYSNPYKEILLYWCLHIVIQLNNYLQIMVKF